MNPSHVCCKGRNLKFRDLGNTWRSNGLHTLCPVSYTHLDVYKRQALESERDLLEKTLCDYQVREEVTQAREERLRRVVEENIHLKNEILYLGAETSRGSHEDLESCKRKVTHYNYQLTRQEELNRRLAEELEDSRSKMKKCEGLLDRNEELESQICKLERVCRGKDNHLAALELSLIHI